MQHRRTYRGREWRKSRVRKQRYFYRVFSHDVTATILASQNNERRPCWCPKPILWELNSFLMQTLSFVPINLHRCWPREGSFLSRGRRLYKFIGTKESVCTRKELNSQRNGLGHQQGRRFIVLGHQ